MVGGPNAVVVRFEDSCFQVLKVTEWTIVITCLSGLLKSGNKTFKI